MLKMLSNKSPIRRNSKSKSRSRKRSPRRISKHKTRSSSSSSSYKHLYPIKSKGHVRRIPTAGESGLLASQLASSIQDALGLKPMYESTEFCNKRFSGCDNPLCTFAHSEPAARWTSEYADEMANKLKYYKRPVGSSHIGFASRLSKPQSNASHYPRMILRINEDEDDDVVKPSMSIAQVERLEKQWLDRKEQLAHDRWVQALMGRPVEKKQKRRVTLLEKLRHLNRVRPCSVVIMEDMEFDDDEMDLE
jgi:hypothetical protein